MKSEMWYRDSRLGLDPHKHKCIAALVFSLQFITHDLYNKPFTHNEIIMNITIFLNFIFQLLLKNVNQNIFLLIYYIYT